MNEADKILLEQKKRQLQINVAVSEWLPRWLPVLDAVKQLNKPWRFEYFDCAKTDELVYWEKNLQKAPLKGLGIILADIKTPDDYPVHRKMEACFPSQRMIRYLPELAHHVPYEENPAIILPQAAAALKIPDEAEVYLFFTRFTPVIRLPFSYIILLKMDDTLSREDMCIMPLDFSCLIFRSLEDEWVWGHKTTDETL